MLSHVRHPPPGRPRRSCRARSSPSTARCASSRPTLSLVAAATEIDDCRTDAPAPLDRDDDDPRRAAGRAPAPAPACRIASTGSSRSPAAASCASATSSTRTASASCARSSTARCSRAVGAGVPRRRRRCCSSPPTPARTVGERHRPVRDLRLRRPARSARCCCCASSPPSREMGRHDHDHSSNVAARDRTGPHARRSTSAPPGERYFRHPGDVVRLVLWGAGHARCSCCSSR